MFIDHLFAKGSELPAPGANLYEYVVGANGIFVRAKRPEMEALIWVASTADPVRGLAEVKPYLRIPRVSEWLVARMFEMAYRAEDREVLFYLSRSEPGSPSGAPGAKWRLDKPAQIQGGASVRPVDPFVGGANTVIEVHSHHNMAAFFSRTDDRDESAGFRIFAVIGNLDLKPTILARVGIYGHFWQVPASWVFALPAGCRDGLREEREVEYVDEPGD